MSRKAKLRVCASCEFIYKGHQYCPFCGFVSYGARFVYGDKAYRYSETQEPWREKRLAHYVSVINREQELAEKNSVVNKKYFIIEPPKVIKKKEEPKCVFSMKCYDCKYYEGYGDDYFPVDRWCDNCKKWFEDRDFSKDKNAKCPYFEEDN